MTTSPPIQLVACDRSNSVLKRLSATSTRSATYSPFGHCATPADDTAALAFNGQLQERDRAYLLGSYRGYNPELKRFASPDSFSPFGVGGLNAYAYCKGDPLNKVDPTGHAPSDLDTLSTGMMIMGGLSILAGGGTLVAKSYFKKAALKNFKKRFAAGMVFNGMVAIGAGLGARKLQNNDETEIMPVTLLAMGAVVLGAGFYGGAKGLRKSGKARVSGSVVPTPSGSITPGTSRRSVGAGSVQAVGDGSSGSVQSSIGSSRSPIDTLLASSHSEAIQPGSSRNRLSSDSLRSLDLGMFEPLKRPKKQRTNIRSVVFNR